MATNIGPARLFQRACPALGLPIRAYLQQSTIRGGSKSELVSQLYSKHGLLLRENGRQGCSSENSGEERPVNEQPYSNPSRWTPGTRSVNVKRAVDPKGLANMNSFNLLRKARGN